MTMILDILAVAAGGGLGATARYAITAAVGGLPRGGPVGGLVGLLGGSAAAGTTLANLLGCLLLGILVQTVLVAQTATAADPPTPPALATASLWSTRGLLLARVGILGSLTTFSTLIGEVAVLIGQDRTPAGLTLLLLNVLAGGLLFWAGIAVVKQWWT